MSTTTAEGRRRYTVRFDDGYVHKFTYKKLRKILIHEKRKKIGRQLDYIFVSNRWKSCVTDCKVDWAPAQHRDLHGERNDHAMVISKWTWRVRTVKGEPQKDFDVLIPNATNGHDKATVDSYIQKFDAAVEEKLQQLEHSQALDADRFYDNITTAIHHAIETVLPDKKRSSGVRRVVSEKNAGPMRQKKGHERRHSDPT